VSRRDKVGQGEALDQIQRVVSPFGGRGKGKLTGEGCSTAAQSSGGGTATACRRRGGGTGEVVGKHRRVEAEVVAVVTAQSCGWYR
jgi:hypothetical protein